MKRILASVLALSMTFSLISNAYAEQGAGNAELSPNVAKIVFDQDGCTKTDNITRVGYKGETELIGGHYALKRDHTIEDGRHIQVTTDNDWLYAPNGTSVEIDIEYFDKGNGFFLLRYNGLNDKKWWEGFTDVWSETEKLTMTDSGEWKTHSFYIEDMKAMNEFQGTDFQISLWTHQHGTSPGDAYIRSITVKKIFAKNPIKIETDSGFVGNNFGPDEQKIIKAKLINTTEYSFKTKATYKVCDYDGNDLSGTVYKEGSFEFESEPYGEYEYTFDLNDLSKFSVYRIYIDFEHEVTFNGEEIVAKSSVPIGFSIINKPEKHERNPVININIHQDKGIEENMVLAGYAGFGATRESIYWFATDPEADGTYTIPKADTEQARMEEENNLGRLFLATYGPTGYLDSEPYDVYHLPTSEKAHQAYADYILYVLKNVPSIDFVSLWNEPAHHGFEINPPENYAEMIKVAYPRVKEKYPDIPLVGIGSAQCDLNLIEGVLKAGGGDYMDAVTFHPYDWSGGTYNLKTLERNVADVNALFEEYTGKKKPIWIDELGMHTGGSLDGKVDSKSNYAEDEQGASYMKIFAVGRTKKLFEKLFYYDLVDDGNNDNYSEHRFGLTKSSMEIPSLRYSAKPGFVQIAGLNKFMWDAEGIECIEPEEGLWLCNFKKPNGENIAIVWTEQGSECNVDLNLGAREIEVFDMYTNPIGKMISASGVHTIGLTKHPLYIKGNFTSFTAQKSNNGIALNYTATHNDAFSMEYITDKQGELRAECDVPASVTVSNMNGISIPVVTEVEAGGDGYLTVKIYNGDDIVYIGQPTITVAEAFMINVESEQVSETDSDHWHMATTIQNSSNTSSISGTCRIIEINGEAVEREPEIFENLRPGESVTLYLNLHEMIKKRNVNLKVEVELENGYKKVVEKELDFTAAMYAKDKPKIDGIIEPGEWKGVWLTADTEDRVTFQSGEWNGPEDLAVDSNLMWDEKYLYFGAIAKDDYHFNDRTPSELWAGDSIQFGIENRVYKGDYRIGMGGTGGSNYTEVGIALLNDGTPAVYRWSTQDGVNPVGEIPNCQVAITTKGNKKYYELAIPWTEMIAPDYVLDPTTIFGFSMLINENDGTGRKGWLEYNSGIGLQKNSIMFGKMKLMSK